MLLEFYNLAVKQRAKKKKRICRLPEDTWMHKMFQFTWEWCKKSQRGQNLERCVFIHLCMYVCACIHSSNWNIHLGFWVGCNSYVFCFDHKSFEELLSLIMNCIFIAVFILYFTNEAAVSPQKSNDFPLMRRRKWIKHPASQCLE